MRTFARFLTFDNSEYNWIRAIQQMAARLAARPCCAAHWQQADSSARLGRVAQSIAPLLAAPIVRAAPAAGCSVPPPPASSHQHSGSRRRLQRAASQAGRGGQPDAQQPASAEGQAGSQWWSNDEAGAAEAGGRLRSLLARSDRFVLNAARALAAPFVFVFNELASLIRGLGPISQEALALLPQLTYPKPALLMRRTVQVLLVVAAFLAYVQAVDKACSSIPRLIIWSQAHPGWGRHLLAGLLAAAKQRLAGAA